MSGSMNAKDVKARAGVWLERRTRETWNEKDQSELDAWLAASPAHEVAYWRLNAAWNRAGRLVALRNASPEPLASTRRNRPWRWIGRSAAGLAVVGALGVGADLFLRHAE